MKSGQFSNISLQNRLLDEQVLAKNRKLLEKACKKLPVKRRSSKFVTGEIATPDAFKRYLGTAKELGLLQEISGMLYNTKRGEILSALSTNDNPFKFNMAQIYFLLRILLEKDYDYISSVFKCSIKNGKKEYENFFNTIKKIWKEKLENIDFKNAQEYDSIKKAINTKWKNPQRYYREDIRATRLEWLLDLKVIEYWNLRTNRVIFRKNFESLLDAKNFSNSFVIFMKSLINGSLTYWKDIPIQKRTKVVERILNQAFILFEPSEVIQKISANQILEYGLSILSESGIVCSLEELDYALKQFILSNLVNYRYVSIISDADRGYISKF